MSLVSHYVKMADGYWYKEPVLYGDNWFICFDDDDPPELVFKAKQNSSQKNKMEKSKIFIESLGLPIKKHRYNCFCGRTYPPDYNGQFQQSICVFIDFNKSIDLNNSFINVKHEGKFKNRGNISGEGVFYDFG